MPRSNRKKKNCCRKYVVITGDEHYHILIPHTRGFRKTLCGHVLKEDYKFTINSVRKLCEKCGALINNLPAQLSIVVKRPIRTEYHADNPHNHCAPVAGGEGCYGDCGDCYSLAVERYARLLKKHNPNIDKTVNELIEVLYERR
jgi:hypothetical protein